MSELADLEIRSDEGEGGGGPLGPEGPEHPVPSRLPAIVIGVAVLLVAAAAGWWFFLRPQPAVVEPEPAPAVAAPQPVPPDPAAEAPAPDDAEPLPTLETSDALVRRLVAGVSASPKLAEWLVNDQLVQRFARIVGNVANDEDPIVHARFLRPGGRFETNVLDGRSVIDPGSYRRFEPLIAAFESLDDEGTATVYQRIRPLIEASYAQLGYPEDLDTALRHCIARVLEVPRVEAPAVHKEVLAYRYDNPQLEALSPAQKALLRTGPRNVARVQAKVRRLADAIGLR